MSPRPHKSSSGGPQLAEMICLVQKQQSQQPRGQPQDPFRFRALPFTATSQSNGDRLQNTNTLDDAVTPSGVPLYVSNTNVEATLRAKIPDGPHAHRVRVRYYPNSGGVVSVVRAG